MTCPNCQKDCEITEQLYGALYTCAHCQAVYFINFQGQPEYGEVQSDVLEELISEPAMDPPSMAPPEMQVSGMEQQPMQEFGSLEPLVDSVDILTPESSFDPMPAADPVPSLSESPADMNAGLDFSSPDMNSDINPFEPQPEQKSNSFSDAAKEISDFGNNEVQLSGLNYDLTISGLDSHETMKLFREAIEDSKFSWDVTELLKSIKNGRIEFKRLSPVKAYILAKRLQFLDIEKKWEQNVLS